MENQKSASRHITRRANTNVPTRANLWALYLKHLLKTLSPSSVPILYWDNYHRWSRAIITVLKSAGLLSYVLSPSSSPSHPRNARKAALALSIMGSRISLGIASLLPIAALRDPRALWMALEEELVPKGVSTFLLCSVSLKEGRKEGESVGEWAFRSTKLREEIRYCGVKPSVDLEYVVSLMMELGHEFEGLKTIWLGMRAEDLKREAVDCMFEGWVIGLCAEGGGGDL